MPENTSTQGGTPSPPPARWGYLLGDRTLPHEGCARRGGVCDCAHRPCAIERGVCEAMSRQGTFCQREWDHEGCHEAGVDGDMRRWWGDAREEDDYGTDANRVRFRDHPDHPGYLRAFPHGR